MNDQDLDDLLRSQQQPTRDDSYWEEFPGRVTRQLRPRREEMAAKVWVGNREGLAWRLGLAGACAVFAVVMMVKFGGNREPQVDAQFARQCYREAAGLFPRQLQAVVMESGSVRLQLADRPEVPDSPPLLLRVCRSSRCATVMTSSGQEIEVLGGHFEVLANGSGGVILLGRDGAWTATKAAGELWRFDAEPGEKRL